VCWHNYNVQPFLCGLVLIWLAILASNSYKIHVAKEKLMTPEQRTRIDTIAALAQRYHPDWDYRDMAYDAVVQDDPRDDEDIAHELAMRAAFP
jgi:hypothetical protein